MAYEWLTTLGGYNLAYSDTYADPSTMPYESNTSGTVHWANNPISLRNVNSDQTASWEYGKFKVEVVFTSSTTTVTYYLDSVAVAHSTMTGYGGHTDGYICFDFGIGIDYQNELAFPVILLSWWYNWSYVTCSRMESAVFNRSDFYDAIMNPYNWTAWDLLKGNNGQYRAELTKIKDTSIGNVTTAHYGTVEDMTRLSFNVDVVPYVKNMNYNSPVIIAYSGVNWLTAELQADAGLLTNQVKCVFKFYIKNVSETTPFYSLTQTFFTTSENYFLLSFVYDNAQQEAVFLPVGRTTTTPSTPLYWGGVSPTSEEKNMLWLWLQASGTPDPDPRPGNPYDNGTTDNGGGGGNPIPQDDVHTPNVPALGAMASGMFTVYCPTDTQLGQIASYLWSDSFIDNVKKYFNNVSDNIIALYVLPLEPEGLQTKNFKIGNLENNNITAVKYLSDRFITVPMGSVVIERRWGTYLDFSPFTKFSAYLPGVGVVALDSDDIMAPPDMNGYMPDKVGSTISLSYTIDLFTGVLVAYVYINGQIRYQFPGRIGYSIPLTGENYTAMGAGFVQAMAGLATTIATGGTAAPFTAGATAAGIVNAMKPEVYRGGNLSGDASMLSLKTPMLIRSAPNIPDHEGLEDFTGGPSYKIDTLTNFSGFTQVVEAHIEGISCTSAERDEIMQLLKGGVLI